MSSTGPAVRLRTVPAAAPRRSSRSKGIRLTCGPEELGPEELGARGPAPRASRRVSSSWRTNGCRRTSSCSAATAASASATVPSAGTVAGSTFIAVHTVRALGSEPWPGRARFISGNPIRVLAAPVRRAR